MFAGSKSLLCAVFSWIAALVMLQTLYFKFSGASESVYIFTRLGMEPAGRWGTGIGELLAGALLLIPRTRLYGALLGIALMAGAIFFHLTELGIEIEGEGGYLFSLVLTKLGIEIEGDGGYLFFLALIVFVCCVVVVFYRLAELRRLLGLRRRR